MAFQSAVLLSAALLTAVIAQDILLPPSISVGPDQIYTYGDGATVSLPCEAVGSPAPTYSWMKNGSPLSMTGIIFPDPSLGSIDIGVAAADSEGYYQCLATNGHGQTMSNLIFLQMGSLPQFASTPTAIYTVQPNDKLCIRCNPPTSVPSAEYYWTYNETNARVTLSSRIQINFNGDLCFASITTTDVGGRVFLCNVKNDIIGTTRFGAYSRITVSGTAISNVAPALNFSSPATVVALQSKQTILRCFFTGTGTIAYSWTYNGGSRLPTGWVFTDGTVSSPATGTDPSDAGTYQCFGSNNVGQASAMIELTVEAIPDFGALENQPHDMNVTDGDTITILCQPNAVPDATIQWFKDTVAFDQTSLPPKFGLSDDLMTLTISDVCKACGDGTSDLMNIQCNASNIHGYSFAQGYVNVLLASTITSEAQSIQWTPNGIYQFDCASTCDDSTPCTTDWTFEGQPVVEAEDQLFVDEQGALHIDTTNDTDAGSARIGTYTCTVSNTYSETSINATIIGDDNVVRAELWWVGLLVALLVLLLLLLVLLCIFCCFCADGKSYPVDERERKMGNNPVQDLKVQGINEYVPNQSDSKGDIPTNGYVATLQPHAPVNVSFTTPPPPRDVDNADAVYGKDPMNVHLHVYTGDESPTTHTYFVDNPRNSYVRNYGLPPSQPQQTVPQTGTYYVDGYQRRTLSRSSQGEVFSAEVPEGMAPYGGDFPHSEV